LCQRWRGPLVIVIVYGNTMVDRNLKPSLAWPYRSKLRGVTFFLLRIPVQCRQESLKRTRHFGARGVPARVAVDLAADVRQRNAGTNVLWDILGLRQAPRAATVGVARLVGELGAARVERGIFAAIAPGPTPSSASTSVVVVHNASNRA
jgi:hypothetical protein